MTTVAKTIRIRNYCGITEQTVKIGKAGVIAKGRNGSGKTSFVNAVRAALSDRGVGTDAVTLGADKAEILIDLGDAVVKRTINAGGGTNIAAESADGFSAIKKPASFLKALLGAGQLDPIELLTERDKAKRIKSVVAAIPLPDLTSERLHALVPEIPADIVVATGHPLVVTGAILANMVEKRREANARVEHLLAVGKEAAAHVERLPDGVANPRSPALLEEAKRAQALIEARTRQASEHEHNVATQREAIENRRTRAVAWRQDAPAFDAAEHEASGNAELVAAAECERLRTELAEWNARYVAAVERHRLSDETRRSREQSLASAAALESEAASMASTLTATTVAAPTSAEISAALASIVDAKSAVAAHEQHAAKEKAQRELSAGRESWKLATREADTLDTIVRKLRTDVPSALIAGSDAIPGLGIDGDEITLDGVNLDRVNEAKRLELAVTIAKRAAPKCRIIVTDQLERLDPESKEAFVRFVTEDGWQLIGACVDRGDLAFEVLEP